MARSIYLPAPGGLNAYHPLVDQELLDFVDAGLISNCPAQLINPASVNLTIGTTAMVEGLTVDGSRIEPLDLGAYSESQPYMVPPGGWILCDVGQYLKLPSDHEAQVILRSSAARRGWDHALAGYVDPGYQGQLTLEFVNCLRFGFLPIWPGQQLVQLRIYQLHRPPLHDYAVTGRYCNATQVEACKDPSV